MVEGLSAPAADVRHAPMFGALAVRAPADTGAAIAGRRTRAPSAASSLGQ